MPKKLESTPTLTTFPYHLIWMKERQSTGKCPDEGSAWPEFPGAPTRYVHYYYKGVT